MGGVLYRRKVRVCTTCHLRLDTTAARRRCEQAGHAIEIRETPVWWLRYRADGRTVCVSAESSDRTVAEALLRSLEPTEPASEAPAAASTTSSPR